jgi:uncharacterized protein
MFPVPGRVVPNPSPENLRPVPELPIELFQMFKRRIAMSDRTYRLLEQHQKLDDELHMELRRSWPSFARIQRLKRLKLAVKDRLQRLVRANNLHTA